MATESERLARLRELLAAARERPPGDRRGFVDEACGEDADLKRELVERFG